MANGTLDSDRPQRCVREEAGDADDGILPQEVERDGRIVEVEAPVFQSLQLRRWQCRRIDLESETEDVMRREGCDRFVQVQLVTPKRFVAERVESKRLLPLVQELLRIVFGAREDPADG
jgi:hypothetical protein